MRSKKVAYTPSKAADFILTTIFGLEVALCLYLFYVTNIYDLYWFIIFCIATCVAVKLTEYFCRTIIYNFVSGYLLAGEPYNHPLSKKRSFKKFIGSAWQFVIHLSMTICEIIILRDEEWLDKPWTCFVDFLTFEPKQSLRLFFILQIAIWVCTGFSHRFNSDAHMHKDYVPMYIHHLATVGLVVIAYSINCARIGIVVLIIHDASDIAIDLLKIFNYLRLEGRRGFYLVEIAYASTLAMWGYLRLYYFPLYIIGQGTLGNLQPFDFLLPEGVVPLTSTLAVALPGDEYNRVYFAAAVCNALLSLLCVLHLWWGALLLRILFRMINASAHVAGRDEYEGESDDELETTDGSVTNRANKKNAHKKLSFQDNDGVISQDTTTGSIQTLASIAQGKITKRSKKLD